MVPDPEPRPPEGSGRLDDRVLATLKELAGRVAFSGLRRVLGAHPESLSRALRRLEREGLVERIDGGYRALRSDPRPSDAFGADLRRVAHVDLPLGTTPEALVGRLAGRWFGSLRWVGVVERDDGRLFAWARRDGSGHVLLSVDARSLTVYRPSRDALDDPSESEEMAYELLVHAVEALRPTTPAERATVSFLRPRAVGANGAPGVDN